MSFARDLLLRLIDIVLAVVAILIFSPALVVALLLVWLYDGKNPVYAPARVGLQNQRFRMYKVRTMIIGADSTKVDSTSDSDHRITPVGRIIRKTKLDEVLQFYNVLTGSMSVVGPRPNIEREVALYTAEELDLLEARPGITDFSSIVFADLGEILEGSDDPNIAYNQLVRPWKSRLGLIYLSNRSLKLYLLVVLATMINVFNRKAALNLITAVLTSLKVHPDIIEVASRLKELKPAPPLGSSTIVSSRIV